MRILLLNPPYKPNFIRSARSTWPSISGSNWYPIFLAYATGWLMKHHHKAMLLDALVTNMPVSDVNEKARNHKTELLVLYISQQSVENDVAIGSEIKKQTGCTLVLVGPWCSYNPESMLEKFPSVDYIVRREFDDAVLDLANGKKPHSIAGLVWRGNNKICSNPERSFLTGQDLDTFPFVSQIYREFVPIHSYYQASLLHPFVDIFTARGCVWGRCTFCLWPNTIHKGMVYRQRSVENVFSELVYIKKYLPEVKEVFFQDDTLAPGRARELSSMILSRNLKMTWSCYSRANVEYETLRLMKQAGCRFLHVGYESSDTAVLSAIHKGTDPAGMERFTDDAKRAGLRIHGDFIIGLPKETERSIRKTIDWAKKLKIEGYQFFTPQPEEGTPLYDWSRKKKYLTSDGNVSYPGLSNEQMQKWRYQAMREIYLTPGYIARTIQNINSADELARLIRTAWYVIPNILKN